MTNWRCFPLVFLLVTIEALAWAHGGAKGSFEDACLAADNPFGNAHDVRPVVICPSLDGSFYGARVQQDQSLVSWHQAVGQPTAYSRINLSDGRSVIVGADDGGHVYSYDAESGNLEKWPWTVPEIVRDAPVESQGLLLAGTKVSHTFILDPATGNSREHKSTTKSGSESAERSGGCVLVLRVNYLVEAYKMQSGEPVGNLSYAEHYFFPSSKESGAKSPLVPSFGEKMRNRQIAPGEWLFEGQHDKQLDPTNKVKDAHLLGCHLFDLPHEGAHGRQLKNFWDEQLMSSRTTPRDQMLLRKEQVMLIDGAALMQYSYVQEDGLSNENGSAAPSDSVSVLKLLEYLAFFAVVGYIIRQVFNRLRRKARETVGDMAVWLIGVEDMLPDRTDSRRELLTKENDHGEQFFDTDVQLELRSDQLPDTESVAPLSPGKGINRELEVPVTDGSVSLTSPPSASRARDPLDQLVLQVGSEQDVEKSHYSDMEWESCDEVACRRFSGEKRSDAKEGQQHDIVTIDNINIVESPIPFISPRQTISNRVQLWSPMSLDEEAHVRTALEVEESSTAKENGGREQHDAFDSIFERDSDYCIDDSEGDSSEVLGNFSSIPPNEVSSLFSSNRQNRVGRRRSRSLALDSEEEKAITRVRSRQLLPGDSDRVAESLLDRTESSPCQIERSHSLELSPEGIKDTSRKVVPDSPLGVTVNRHCYDLGFEELGVIGFGAYGVVARAKNLMDGVEYAIKKVKLKEKESVWQKVSREVHAMARVTNHPNIVTYFNSWVEKPTLAENDEATDCFRKGLILGELGQASVGTLGSSILGDGGESDSSASLMLEEDDDDDNGSRLILYIQMELCSESLTEWMNREGTKVGLTEKLSMFRQLLQAVCHVHSMGFVHRDIKPSNIFTQKDKLKLGDFGLAKSFGALSAESEERSVVISPLSSESREFEALARESLGTNPVMTTRVGTTLYASPEQLAGRRACPKSDMYSLGIVLAEMLLTFSTEMERVSTLCKLRLREIPSTLSELSEEIADCVRRLLDPDPRMRPSAIEVLAMDFMKSDNREDLEDLVRHLRSELRRRAMSD